MAQPIENSLGLVLEADEAGVAGLTDKPSVSAARGSDGSPHEQLEPLKPLSPAAAGILGERQPGSPDASQCEAGLDAGSDRDERVSAGRSSGRSLREGPPEVQETSAQLQAGRPGGSWGFSAPMPRPSRGGPPGVESARGVGEGAQEMREATGHQVQAPTRQDGESDPVQA
jgi:hypothetical protein